jgi:hypothetical protein
MVSAQEATMAWELFQNDIPLGPISGLQLIEGKQEFQLVRIPGFPDERIPTFKNPDEVTFSSQGCLDIVGTHELRDSDSKKVLRIVIEDIHNNRVHALVQPELKSE